MIKINIKALLSGIASIIFLGLLLQLIFILSATAYNSFINTYPQWHGVARVLAYISTVSAYFAIMSFSAYISAAIAKKNIYLHACIISLFTSGLSLISSIRDDNFTFNSLAFIVSGIIFALIGSYIWQSSQPPEEQ